MARVQSESLVLILQVSALSVIARSWAPLKVLAQFGISQCSQNFALHNAMALILAIAVMIRSS